MRYPGHALDCQGMNVASTEEIVQSATLWNINAVTAFGGFNETFGMDAVDAHACLSLREAGLVVATVADLEINHRIGSAQPVTIKGRNPVFLTGHSPERRTLMVRNRLALFPSEFRQSPRHAFRTLRRVLVNQAGGLMVETDKWSKASGSLRGLIPSRKR
jgi:GT2 family glycosyltransferase